jgi:2-polyprenyl-6-hydroxyphenyl methylase/3-demethylubiquinone-9 3-methyltransferase
MGKQENMDQSTIDDAEVNKFSKLAQEWWDPEGPFRTLHQINPIRLSYVKDKIVQHFGSFKPSLNIIDIGCGGGLISVPLAKLGANITGIDASLENIETAKFYAKDLGLEINFLCGAAEDHQEKYDVILCLEVIEHVSSPEFFIESIKKLLKPGGMMMISTINRTPKAYLSAIIGAEYILNWVPRGTHEFNKFLKPSELSQMLNKNDLQIKELKGLGLDILTRNWKLCDDIKVNYFAYIA